MNSKDFRSLTEAYSNIYEEDQDLFGFQDEDYEAIMTELVEELLDEGYELEESLDITEESFLDYIEEASVTFGHDTRGMRTPEERKTAAKAKLSARKVKYQKDAIQRVKSKPTRMLQSIARADQKLEKKTKDAVDSVKSAGREAKFKAVDKHVASYANKRKLDSAPGLKARSKDPEKRRGLRAKVAKDIGDRAKMKAAKAQVSAYNKAKSVKTAAGDAAGKAKQSAKNMGAKASRSVSNAASSVKKGLKGLIKRAADKVASGANKVSKRMSEEYDQFDLVLEFLQTEGFAESLDEARVLMVNELDREDIETIVNAYN